MWGFSDLILSVMVTCLSVVEHHTGICCCKSLFKDLFQPLYSIAIDDDTSDTRTKVKSTIFPDVSFSNE